MGFFDRFSRKTQDSKPEILTKKPGFAITRFTSNNPFTNLIENEGENYYNQYILYTWKAIDYISNKLASSKVSLYQGNRKDPTEIRDDVIIKDLESFNPHMNWWEARKLRMTHIFLTGSAVWYIDRDPLVNKDVEYYPLDPTKITIKTDSIGLPAYYQYLDADGRRVDLDVKDIIYFKSMNPRNWFEGMSVIKPLLYHLNAYAQGAQYNMSKLGNNINADKLIYFEGIGEEAKQKLESELSQKYGGARNAGRTGVVAQKPEIIDVSSSQKDLDYVNGMKLLREDILAFFGIPEALFFPSATNANTKESVRLFQSDTIEPLVIQEVAAYNEQIINKVGRVEGKFFDYEGVVDADKTELVDQATKLMQAKIFTRNQALEYIGEKTVKGGDIYLSDTQEEQQTQEEVKTLYEETKALSSKLEEMIEDKYEKEFMMKDLGIAEDQEGIVYTAAISLFEDQFSRVIKYINKTDNVTVRGVFNLKEEVDITRNTFNDVYSKVINNANENANLEIKQKLLRKNLNQTVGYKNKSLSIEAVTDIAKHLEYFSEEISETTMKKLRKLIVNGIENGFDKDTFREAVKGLFNEFVDGRGNIDTLVKSGVYVEAFTLNSSNEVSVTQSERYRQMLSAITNSDLTNTQKDDALKALRGLVDPSSIVGREIDALLTNVYRVNKDKGIKHSRAVTIARTESTYARNLGFEDTYKDNPFVRARKWSSALDSFTRESHSLANGQIANLDEPFKVGTSKLRFPGDTSQGAPAEEIVNCRCRITAVVI